MTSFPTIIGSENIFEGRKCKSTCVCFSDHEITQPLRKNTWVLISLEETKAQEEEKARSSGLGKK